MPDSSRPRSRRRIRALTLLAVLASVMGVLSIVSPAPVARASASGSSLTAGETLPPGALLSSPSGQYQLRMQADGNVVLYGACNSPAPDTCATPLWSLGTYGQPGNRLTMQTDGNLVLRSQTGRAVWATMTKGMGNTFRVQDDTNMVVYNGARPVWNSGIVGTYAHLAGHQVTDLTSPNGRYAFGVPGNSMHVWDRNTPIWGVNCLNDPRVNCDSLEGRLILQTDGNLVWYQPGKNGGRVAEWNSGTAGAGPTAYLVLQNDGNLVLYDLWHRALWSSKSGLVRR